MSEELGVHVQLIADAAGFAQAINNARDTLVDLSLQAKNLKQGERDIEKVLADTAKRYGENSTKLERYKNDLIDNKRAQLEVKEEIKKATAELKRQQTAFDNLSNPVKKYNNTLSDTAEKNEKLSSTLKKGMLALKGIAVGYAGKTLYESLIGGNAEFEQYMTSFEVLLQSAEKAESMMKDLNKFGADTPFELPDVTEAAQKLSSFGVAEEEVMLRLQQLGDLSGGNAEKLERITSAYGKMHAKGKVSLEELNMLTEAGVPILKELANQYGVTEQALFKMITDGKVNIDGINKSINAMTGEGGQFFGMMEKQSQTMTGLLSTLSDNVNMFARDVGSETFEYLKEELIDLMNTIQQMNEDGSLKEMAGEIGSDVANAVTFVGNLIKILWDMRSALTAVGIAVVAFKGLLVLDKGIKQFEKFSKNVKTLYTIFKQGINPITLYNAAINQNEKAIKKCNEAKLENITVTKGQITATNSATKAQLTMDAAMLASPTTLILAGVAAAVGAVTFAVSSYNQYIDETKQKAKELTDEYKSQMETLAEAEKKLTDENTSREELINTIKSLNGKYDEEQAKLKKTNELRREGIDLLYDEAKAAAEKTLREGYSGYVEANNTLGSKVEGGMSWNAGRNWAVQRLAYQGYLGNDVINSDFYYALPKADALERVSAAIDNLNEKQSSGIELSEQERQALLDLTNEYNRLEPVVSEAEQTKKAYENAVRVARGEVQAYKEMLEEGTITQDEYNKKVKETQDTLAGASISEAISNLKTAGDDISKMGDVLNDFKDKGAATIKSMSELNTAFGKLDGYNNFINTLTNSKSTYEQVRQAASELVSEYISSSSVIDDLNDDNKDLITNQLKAMGVTNSQAIITAALTSKKIEAKVSTFDFTSATEDEIQALYDECSQLGATEQFLAYLEAQKMLAANPELANMTAEEIAQFLEEQRASKSVGEAINYLALQKQLANAGSLAAVTRDEANAMYELATAAGAAGKALYYKKYYESYQGPMTPEQYNLMNGITEPSKNPVNIPKASFTPVSSSKGKKSSDKDNADKERKKQLDAYKSDIEAKERLDERWNQNEKERGRLTDEAWLSNLADRANRYRKYADEVLALPYITAEEKAELQRKYLEKAEDADLDYYKYYKGLVEEETQARKEAYEQRREISGKWIANAEKEGSYDAAVEGYERVKAYTSEYYENEKEKLDEHFAEGLMSQKEYNKQAKTLGVEFGKALSEIDEDIVTARKNRFEAWYKDAQAYISNNDFYGDWGKFGDSAENAIARMFSKIDDAYRMGEINFNDYIEKCDALSKQLYSLEYGNMQDAIKEQEQLLKEKYKKELDMRTQAAEKEIEIAREKAEAEKNAINEAADNEIKRIDELIQKRKEAREDEDYDLRMRRLKAKLEYEHDENNRIALQKEINKLKREIEDTQFERDMEKRKELVEKERDEALKNVEIRLERENVSAERKKKIAESRYEENTSGQNIALELSQMFNLQSFEDLYKTIGTDIGSSLSKGIQGIINALGASLNDIADVKTNKYDYSVNGNTYKMYNTFSGVQTPAQAAKALRKLLDQLELEARM